MNSNRLPLRLDFHSAAPIYVQIVDQIRSLAVNQVLEPGDPLPTVRGLARELRINFNTVARAYRLLAQARVIATQQGRGSYVSEVPLPQSNHRLRAAALQRLTRRYVSDALRLGYSAAEIRQFVASSLKSEADARDENAE